MKELFPSTTSEKKSLRSCLSFNDWNAAVFDFEWRLEKCENENDGEDMRMNFRE